MRLHASRLHSSAGFLLLLLLFITACGRSGPGDLPNETDRSEILDLLTMQERDWNAGNIEGFMQGYWRTDSLRFASGGTVRYGWDATLERYHATYPDRDAMGRLAFSELDIDLVSGDRAIAFGRWHLTRGQDYADIGGLFTLLLRRTEEGWRITADHTSSE